MVPLSDCINRQFRILDYIAVMKWMLICLMFFGRVGIMTIGVGLMMSDRAEDRYRYAETKLLIG